MRLFFLLLILISTHITSFAFAQDAPGGSAPMSEVGDDIDDMCNDQRWCRTGQIESFCCGRKPCSGRNCRENPSQEICYTCGANECTALGNNLAGRDACYRCCAKYCTDSKCKNNRGSGTPANLAECKKGCSRMTIGTEEPGPGPGPAY